MDASGIFKSEDDLSEPNTDSFWDIGNYKRVVKRIEDGLRLSGDLTKMAQERIDIESKYSKNLQHWAKKWEEIISKGSEYGSMEVGWKACIQESTKLAEIHTEMSQNILEDIIESIQSWKNNHFHKSLVHLKETKRAEEGFSTAQKPWAKKLSKCVRARKAYHHTAKEVEILANQVHTADVSPEISAETCQKLRAKHERAEGERDRALEKYRDRLGEVQRYKSRYEEDMTMQFSKCQEAEMARLEFLKTTFYKLENILDLTKKQRLNDIYNNYVETLNRISPEDDLRWYAINFGTGMSYSWPEFEEYAPGQSKLSSHDVSHRNPSPRLAHSSGGSSSTSGTSGGTGGAGTSGGAFSRVSEPSSSNCSSPSFNSVGRNETGEEEEEEWLEPPPQTEESFDITSGSRSGSEEPEGRLMRALYDYSGETQDDLFFREGELVRIMYEGDDGWAEGKIGDKYGYVPISYFEAV